MNGCFLLLITVAYFVFFYFVYGKFLSKVFKIDPSRKTPAYTRYDGIDYTPTSPYVLFGHHFASIAGAGPIIGPIVASEIGWIPAILWIFIGCVFVGAMHDFAAMFLSVRNQGNSIAFVIAKLIGYGGRLIFSMFCWATLILVVAVFGIMIADIFVKTPSVATASILFILMAPVFGFFVNRKLMNILVATLIFVPLTFATVFVGISFPFDLIKLGWVAGEEQCRLVWLAVLGVYIFIASVVPVQWLLQPRDYLNSFLLYALLIAGFVGILLFAPSIEQTGYLGMTVHTHNGDTSVFPTLFILIACGACSGFHSLVASGTSSKQIASESHIQPVGYGGMLVEGVLGVMSLLTVIYLSDVSFGEAVKHPQLAFADGMSEFITKIGLSRELSHPFISLVLAAFMMTSLDTATRLGRFVWQEILTGRGTSAEAQIRNPLIKSVFGFLSNSVIASMIIVGLAGYLACSGQGTSIWPVFGAANQLLAALTLLGISLYLIRIKSHSYIALIPMLFMMVMSSWGLIDIIRTREGVLVYASGLLLLLTVFLVILAFKRLVPGAEQKAVNDP